MALEVEAWRAPQHFLGLEKARYSVVSFLVLLLVVGRMQGVLLE